MASSARVRRHYQSSTGEYARALRLRYGRWSSSHAMTVDLPGSRWAAGFADQSHFTRACRSVPHGLAPAAYRRNRRSRELTVYCSPPECCLHKPPTYSTSPAARRLRRRSQLEWCDSAGAGEPVDGQIGRRWQRCLHRCLRRGTAALSWPDL